MALAGSVSMTFVSFDVIPAPQNPATGQDTGISAVLQFSCAQPGPNMPSTYQITLTSADLAAIQASATKPATLRATVIDHLQKQYRPTSAINSVLDGLIGQSVSV